MEKSNAAGEDWDHNLERGRAVSAVGIYDSNFRYSMYERCKKSFTIISVSPDMLLRGLFVASNTKIYL
jgi:hypothetical protein